MGSTSQAQPASMRRCPGAAGPQYSMYPVGMRGAQPTEAYLFGSKMVLQTCSDWTGTHYRTCTVCRTLVRCAPVPSKGRSLAPQSVTTLF